MGEILSTEEQDIYEPRVGSENAGEENLTVPVDESDNILEKQAINKRSYRKELMYHTGFKCDQCEYSTSMANNLKKHVSKVHRKLSDYVGAVHKSMETLECDKCEYVTNKAAD